MSLVFPTPLQFRSTKFHSLFDICSRFKPAKYNTSDYMALLRSRFIQKRPVGDVEFIRNIKPHAQWLFFCGSLYDSPTKFAEHFEIPLGMVPSIESLIVDDEIETENSLIMFIQAYRRESISSNISTHYHKTPLVVFDRTFDSLHSCLRFMPFINLDDVDFKSTEIERDIEKSVEKFIADNPRKLGVVFIDSLASFCSYAQLTKWEVVLKLRTSFYGKNLEAAVWPHLSQSDTPVVVGRELYRDIRDAFRAHAIDRDIGMNFLTSQNVVTPAVIDSLFLNNEVLRTSTNDLVTHNGELMTLDAFIREVGGHASVYIDSLKRRFNEYHTLTMAQMIESDMLDPTDVVLAH